MANDNNNIDGSNPRHVRLFITLSVQNEALDSGGGWVDVGQAYRFPLESTHRPSERTNTHSWKRSNTQKKTNERSNPLDGSV